MTTPLRRKKTMVQAPPHGPMRYRNYDWGQISSVFINGVEQGDGQDRHYPNLRELAEMFYTEGSGGPSFETVYSRIRKVSSDQRWPNKKDAAQMVLVKERQRQRAKLVAKYSLDFDDKSHTVAKNGLALIQIRLGEIAAHVAANRPFRDDAMERMRQGEVVEKKDLYSAIYGNELLALANAADRFQTVGMKALGTDVHRADVNVSGGLVGGDTNVTVNVGQELVRDDADRLARMIAGMKESELINDAQYRALTGQEDSDIVDGEVIEQPATNEGKNDDRELEVHGAIDGRLEGSDGLEQDQHLVGRDLDRPEGHVAA